MQHLGADRDHRSHDGAEVRQCAPQPSIVSGAACTAVDNAATAAPRPRDLQHGHIADSFSHKGSSEQPVHRLNPPAHHQPASQPATWTSCSGVAALGRLVGTQHSSTRSVPSRRRPPRSRLDDPARQALGVSGTDRPRSRSSQPTLDADPDASHARIQHNLASQRPRQRLTLPAETSRVRPERVAVGGVDHALRRPRNGRGARTIGARPEPFRRSRRRQEPDSQSCSSRYDGFGSAYAQSRG
ncbi:hypothetical protein SALBM311S_11908 [Streptomyces alboniger]